MKILFTKLSPGQKFFPAPNATPRSIHMVHATYVSIIRHDGPTKKEDWYGRVYPDSPLWSKEVEVIGANIKQKN